MSFKTNDGYYLVWTDGSCIDNGRPQAKAGIGVFFSDSNGWNLSEPVIGKATNQVAEIQAARHACQQASKIGIKNLRIYTDSHYVIKSMTEWIHNWVQNDWRNVVNSDELKKLQNAVRQLSKVDWQYVEAHAGNYENNQADALAKAGAERYKPAYY